MAILLSLASQRDDGYQFSHDSYFALAEPLPRSVYHIGDYITVLYLFTCHKKRDTHLHVTYIYGIASFLAHSACNHHGSFPRLVYHSEAVGRALEEEERNNPHSFYFFFPSFCYILYSPFPSLLFTQSPSLAPIALPKPNVTTLGLSSQPARIQHFGVTYTRPAYRTSLPAGSHH